MTKHIVYLGLGTNLGDKNRNVSTAIDMIAERVGDIVRKSSLRSTLPWGFESDNEFVNAVVCVHTSLTPESLLAVTQQIESEMGRKEKTVAGEYADRIIDIDILLYDDAVINTPSLVVPHPLMFKRDFVMLPLKEIMTDVQYQELISWALDNK